MADNGGTNWGELIQGWDQMAMDWYSLITQRSQPAPPTVLGKLTGADLARPTAQSSSGLVLLAAVAIAVVLLLRK